MPSLLIDLQGITADHLDPADDSVLANALRATTDPQQPACEGPAFDNNI